MVSSGVRSGRAVRVSAGRWVPAPGCTTAGGSGLTDGVTLTFPRGPAWPNAYALAPLTNKQSNPDGTLSDDEHRWLQARAEGGFGLVMTCATYVSPAGKAWAGQLGISSDDHLPGLTRLATSLREAGAVSSVQLHHGGRRASSEVSGVATKAPWDDPATGATALSTAEVREAVEDFVSGAVRAERAGFDGVELHGAHGYLIGQFLDGRSNHRDDGYGGSLDDRSRFLREVLAGVRGATGPDFQVGLRLTPERMGITLAEFREVAGGVLASGQLDYLDVSMWDVRKAPHEAPGAGSAAAGSAAAGSAAAGSTAAGSAGWAGLLMDHVADLPRHGARVGVAGAVKSAGDAAWCLERGADFVLVGTGAILHHDFARKAAADAGFAAVAHPVSREHLAAEAVGPAFVDYLADNWDDFVA